MRLPADHVMYTLTNEQKIKEYLLEAYASNDEDVIRQAESNVELLRKVFPYDKDLEFSAH